MALLLPPCLLDDDHVVRDAAAQALAALAEPFARDEGVVAEPESFHAHQAGRRHVVESLHQAILHWPTHRRDDLILAALRLVRPGDLAYGAPDHAVARWLLMGSEPAHMRLRRLIRSDRTPMSCRLAWDLLGRGVAREASLARLAAMNDEDRMFLCRRAHLLENPRRVRALRYTRTRLTARLAPKLQSLSREEACVSLGAVRLALADPTDSDTHAHAEQCLRHENPFVRLAAFVRQPQHLAAPLASDTASAVARCALARVPSGSIPRDVIERLAQASDVALRLAAAQERECLDPWCGESERSRLAARRALAGADGGEAETGTTGTASVSDADWLACLRRRFCDGDPSAQREAIMLVRMMGLEDQVELELLRCATSADEGVASAAIAALGRVPTPAAGAAVSACLVHPVPRVRANAIEATRRRRRLALPGTATDRLIELKGDAHHRVRSTAWLVLTELRVWPGSDAREAMASLAPMLDDARPLHRLAGLWAAERAVRGGHVGEPDSLHELASRIAAMATREREPAIRLRAAHAGAALLARLRREWGARAATLSQGAGS